MAEIGFAPLPFKEAIEAFQRRARNLDPSFSWLDRWGLEHGRMFTVAKTAGFQYGNEVLAVLADAIGKGALEGGKTFQQFVKEVTPKLQALGWWGRAPMTDPLTGETSMVQLGSLRRLKTIFDVNLRVSYAAGKWEQAQRLKDRRPWLRYVAVMDDRTRHEHRGWHGTILAVDHEWWSTHFPPNGWNCRCTVMQLGQADLDRNGWQPSDKPPPGGVTEWENKRTGETEMVPDGIDPGFVHNPGKGALDAKAVDGLMDAGAKAEPGNAAATVPKILNTPKPPAIVEPPAAPPGSTPAPAPGSAPVPGSPPPLSPPGAPMVSPPVAPVAPPVTAPARTPLDDLVDSWQQWLDARRGPGVPDAKTVGLFSLAVIAALERQDVILDSAAIAADRRSIDHAARMRGTGYTASGLPTTVPPEVIRQLPRILATPGAVVLDKTTGSVLLLFDVGEDIRLGKVVVAVNTKKKAIVGGKRVGRTINTLTTIYYEDRESLRNSKLFTLLDGRI